MKIKIIKVSKPTYWYADKKGHIFDVIEENTYAFLISHHSDENKELLYVFKCDAKVIKN